MRLSPSLLVILGFALLLAGLSVVTWRQSRALERLAELDHLRRELSLTNAERAELAHRIQVLESRARVVPAAADRLDMRAPSADEIVLLPGVER